MSSLADAVWAEAKFSEFHVATNEVLGGSLPRPCFVEVAGLHVHEAVSTPRLGAALGVEPGVFLALLILEDSANEPQR